MLLIKHIEMRLAMAHPLAELIKRIQRRQPALFEVLVHRRQAFSTFLIIGKRQLLPGKIALHSAYMGIASGERFLQLTQRVSDSLAQRATARR